MNDCSEEEMNFVGRKRGSDVLDDDDDDDDDDDMKVFTKNNENRESNLFQDSGENDMINNETKENIAKRMFRPKEILGTYLSSPVQTILQLKKIKAALDWEEQNEDNDKGACNFITRRESSYSETTLALSCSASGHILSWEGPIDRWFRSSSQEKSGQLLLEQIVGSESAQKLLSYSQKNSIQNDFHVEYDDDLMTDDMKVIFVNRDDITDSVEMEVSRIVMRGNGEDVRIILSFRPSDSSHLTVASTNSLLTNLIMKNMQDSILLLDKSGKISQINEVTSRIFEYSKHEIIGQNFTFLFCDEKTKMICQIFIFDVINKAENQIIKLEEKIMFTGDINATTKSGKNFPVEIILRPLIDKTQNLNEIILAINIRNITDRKNAEIAKLEQKKQEEDQQMARQLLGYIDHEVRDILNGIRGFLESLILCFEKYINFNHYFNIIESNEFLKDLKCLQKLFSSLNRIVDNVLDIRKLEENKLELDLSPCSVNNLLKKIFTEFYSNSHHNHNINHNHNVNHNHNTNHNHNINHNHDINHNHNINHNPQILFSFQELETDCNLILDQQRISQIVLNLLSNAEKYTKQGMIRLRASLIPEKNDTQMLRISVSDTGIGISPEQRELMFKPRRILNNNNNYPKIHKKGKKEKEEEEKKRKKKYEKNDNNDNDDDDDVVVDDDDDDDDEEEEEGSGLGLYLCERLVLLMGGKINYESQIGVGSTFFFIIPANKVENTSSSAIMMNPLPVSRAIKSLRFYQSQKRFLVVDDSAINLQLLIKILESLKAILVVPAKDGYEALNLVENQEFDLIFMDNIMPNKNGIETTREMRKKRVVCPIVGLTGDDSQHDHQLGLDAGQDIVLKKPCSPSLIVNCLIMLGLCIEETVV